MVGLGDRRLVRLQDHLWLRGLEDEVSELLHLQVGLEGQLELGALDYDVGEVNQISLQGIQHALPGHDDLLGLLLHRWGWDESPQQSSTWPAGPEASPYKDMDDLEEELASLRVECEDGSVDGFDGHVAPEGLVDGDSCGRGVDGHCVCGAFGPQHSKVV